ncbi:hypothetical protein GCM10023115_48250 [Pontixanthobacter gangjinensis]
MTDCFPNKNGKKTEQYKRKELTRRKIIKSPPKNFSIKLINIEERKNDEKRSFTSGDLAALI